MALVCFSCEHRETYYYFHEFKNDQWSQKDTLYFDIDSSSVMLNTPIDIQIEVVNNTNYLFQNIWLYIEDDFSNNKFQRYEKQYELTDEMGKWHGSGFGSLYQLTLNYKKGVVFTQKRNYRLKMVQGMRAEPLTGIEKVGIKLYISE